MWEEFQCWGWTCWPSASDLNWPYVGFGTECWLQHFKENTSHGDQIYTLEVINYPELAHKLSCSNLTNQNDVDITGLWICLWDFNVAFTTTGWRHDSLKRLPNTRLQSTKYVIFINWIWIKDLIHKTTVGGTKMVCYFMKSAKETCSEVAFFLFNSEDVMRFSTIFWHTWKSYWSKKWKVQNYDVSITIECLTSIAFGKCMYRSLKVSQRQTT